MAKPVPKTPVPKTPVPKTKTQADPSPSNVIDDPTQTLQTFDLLDLQQYT